MPQIAKEIMAINLANDKGNSALLKLIEQDPAISARVIGLANSPLFGTNRKILSVTDAAAVLGIKKVKMIALSFAMISFMNSKTNSALNILQLWQHSMAVALAMDALSRAMPPSLRPASRPRRIAHYWFFALGISTSNKACVFPQIKCHPRFAPKFETKYWSFPI
jgi:HD-like signal output (HDOD) protein